MTTKNIFRVFLTAVFVLGTAVAMNAQTMVYIYKSNGTTDEYNIAEVDSISFTPPAIVEVDYSPLFINEIDGNFKFVEIYNSGTEDIPLKGVKLDRNNGQSSWTGTAADVIPAGAYRLFEFNGATDAVTGSDANVGWKVNSGISANQGLLIVLLDPEGSVISGFRRGNSNAILGVSNSVTPNIEAGYSRMNDGTWAYAVQTPGAANGASVGAIGNGTPEDGYLVLP